mmetsp:Transcript_1313/g.2039  ORF Transcript_1313/g.2039 Transcript_1313/m.2039 type:complete len:216 (-) Transcript_1313:440-1087(-)
MHSLLFVIGCIHLDIIFPFCTREWFPRCRLLSRILLYLAFAILLLFFLRITSFTFFFFLQEFFIFVHVPNKIIRTSLLLLRRIRFLFFYCRFLRGGRLLGSRSLLLRLCWFWIRCLCFLFWFRVSLEKCSSRCRFLSRGGSCFFRDYFWLRLASIGCATFRLDNGTIALYPLISQIIFVSPFHLQCRLYHITCNGRIEYGILMIVQEGHCLHVSR